MYQLSRDDDHSGAQPPPFAVTLETGEAADILAGLAAVVVALSLVNRPGRLNNIDGGRLYARYRLWGQLSLISAMLSVLVGLAALIGAFAADRFDLLGRIPVFAMACVIAALAASAAPDVHSAGDIEAQIRSRRRAIEAKRYANMLERIPMPPKTPATPRLLAGLIASALVVFSLVALLILIGGAYAGSTQGRTVALLASVSLGTIGVAAGTFLVQGILVGLVDRSAFLASFMAFFLLAWALLGALLIAFLLLEESESLTARAAQITLAALAFYAGPLLCLLDLRYRRESTLWFLRPGIVVRRGIERHITSALDRLATVDKAQIKDESPAVARIRRIYLQYRFVTGDEDSTAASE